MIRDNWTVFVIFILFNVNYVQAQPLSKGIWISTGIKGGDQAVPLFRKDWEPGGPVVSAMLNITTRGLYEARINGRRVGEAYFTPGWTSYDKRLQWQEYDVTGLLGKGLNGGVKGGHNEIEVAVSSGWYNGVYGGDLESDRYGKQAALLLQLEIVYKDGSTETVVSDSSWRWADGPILSTGFYDGEVCDFVKVARDWRPVVMESFTKDNLVATVAEPVKRQEMFKPVKLFVTPKGEQVADFGQNMAGFVSLRFKGKQGDTVKIYYAEALDKEGNFYTGNLREAKARDIYILNGEMQTLEPHFTYHGFRYIRVAGCKVTKDNCKAIALHNALRHTGSFQCSDPLINRLQQNIEWSLNSNFVDIPTDCPQRSERLGWTGDVQVFCRTAAFNRDVRLFFYKWLADLRADQGINGGIPNIVPDLYRHGETIKKGVAGWGDAATIVPWTLFELYKDTVILRQQYGSMKAWVDYITASSKDNLWMANGYGDWYAPGDVTSIPFIDECFYYYSTSLLLKAAEVLHHTEDLVIYTRLRERVREAFLTNYGAFDSQGTSTQAAYVLALQFEILPDSLRPVIAARLAQKIRENNNHLATGFLGTPYLLEVLSKWGYTDLAYTVLKQTTIPSWLYPVTKGATTIWEKWDAVKEDGSFDTCSLNHYAYGAVGNWLYSTVAGIQPLTAGYDSVRIAPRFGGGISWVKASYVSLHGVIAVEWKMKGGRMKLKVRVPKDTKAVIVKPDGKEKVVGGIKEMRQRYS